MDRKGVYEGQTVITLDGEKLGKVILCEQDYFIVEKGMLFPKDYAVRYEYVRGGDEGHAILSLTKEQIKNGEGEIASPYGQGGFTDSIVSPVGAGRETRLTEVSADSVLSGSTTDSFRNAGMTAPLSTGSSQNFVTNESTTTDLGRDMSGLRAGAVASHENLDLNRRNVTATEEVKVPLMEEKMEVTKHSIETGEVVIHKEVVTEMKHITVPVSHEEVHIERVAVRDGESPSATVAAGAAAFQDATIRVPLHEEQIEVIKRPVVKEEIRVTKDIVQEQRTAEAEIRKERVDIKEDLSSETRKSDLLDKDLRSKDRLDKDYRAS